MNAWAKVGTLFILIGFLILAYGFNIRFENLDQSKYSLVIGATMVGIGMFMIANSSSKIKH